ncbi:MAG: FHA domain-containing protein [Phycisphaeraceae bacterium]|nr:MAG: FHA domain-containing protein [Phycisphaeraceae bacterium]
MLVLSVIQGPDKGRKYELPAHEPQLIGRSSEALPLSDTTVSRRHAELTPDDGAWYIRDLQSQNGTFVNGVRIAQRTKLRPGDQVRTGATLFVFGQTEVRDADVIRVLRPEQMDASIERTLQSNEDSLVLSEPEPRAAAVDHLRVIYRLTTLTARALDKNELLSQAMDLIFAEFKPERGFIVLLRKGAEESPEPAVVKYATPPRDTDEAKIHVSRTIFQHVIRQGEGVLSSNAMTDPRFAKGDSVQRGHVRSAVCSPIRHGDRTFGAIYIDSTVANYTFTEEQLALMNAIGQHTGLALANAELYQQKLQAERLAAIGETVANLSHSIKNILQGLRGGADVVEMGLRKDDLKIARGGWAILQRNLDRIVSLTLNMLAFSRQRRVEPEVTRLAPLIDECMQLVDGQAKAKQVAVLSDVDPEMPPVTVDPHLVHQTLMNLLSNAVEAVEPGRGVVTVRAHYRVGHPPWSPPSGGGTGGGTAHALTQSAPHAWVEIGVIDNGPGIPKGKQAWVFEPFNTTKGVRGTGLGLAVARRVVEEHGGRIWLESDEGKGAQFVFWLPADTAGGVDPSATTGQKPEPRPL